MICRAYSIFDRKALTYANPFFALTDGAAMRIVQDLANDVNTMLGRHPADYVLYSVGKYNDANGLFVAEVPLVHIIDVIGLVKNIDLSQATGDNVAQLRSALVGKESAK